MLLLDETLTIVPEQTKTTIEFCIHAPQDFDRLEIDAEYFPKVVTDADLVLELTQIGAEKWHLLPTECSRVRPENCPEILNMITLSLDINDRFCGYAHRHDPVQHIVITKDSATPGFHPMQPTQGVWRLLLPVCMVATPKVTYRIRVSAYREEEA